jgi:hypothetical protein
MNTIKFAAMFLTSQTDSLFACFCCWEPHSVIACETDLDANAPYKETAVVYGLLDFNQTRQYMCAYKKHFKTVLVMRMITPK